MSGENFRPSYKTCTEVTARCPVAATTYGYYPDLGPNAFFCVFFGILLIVSLGIGVKTKKWSYTAFLGVGLLGEFLGYIGRIMMHANPWNSSAFQLQICCLVLSPSFVAGAIYLTTKHLVLYCGPHYSRLRAQLYPWVFIGCDLGSILLQAAGGGLAAGAGKSSNITLLDAGNGLIVAGIAFQVTTMAVCGILVLDFLVRFRKGQTIQNPHTEKPQKSGYESDLGDGKKHRNFYIFSGAILLAYATVLIRCIYRLPEMAGGWGNALMQRENEFLLLDGMMIALACFAMTVVHPGIFFTPMRKFRSNATPKRSRNHIFRRSKKSALEDAT